MGLAMGIIFRWKDRKKNYTTAHKNLIASQFSVTLSLLGSAILMISMPFFSLLHQNNYGDQTSTSVNGSLVNNDFLSYTPTLCLIFSSSAGLIGALSISLITGRKPNVRTFIHGPIAGSIIGGTSSLFTANLAYCIGVGLFGGSLQSAIHHLI